MYFRPTHVLETRFIQIFYVWDTSLLECICSEAHKHGWSCIEKVIERKKNKVRARNKFSKRIVEKRVSILWLVFNIFVRFSESFLMQSPKINHHQNEIELCFGSQDSFWVEKSSNRQKKMVYEIKTEKSSLTLNSSLIRKWDHKYFLNVVTILWLVQVDSARRTLMLFSRHGSKRDRNAQNDFNVLIKLSRFNKLSFVLKSVCKLWTFIVKLLY